MNLIKEGRKPRSRTRIKWTMTSMENGKAGQEMVRRKSNVRKVVYKPRELEDRSFGGT